MKDNIEKLTEEYEKNLNDALIKQYDSIMELAWEAAVAFDNGEEIPSCPFSDPIDVVFYDQEFKRLINSRQNK